MEALYQSANGMKCWRNYGPFFMYLNFILRYNSPVEKVATSYEGFSYDQRPNATISNL